MKIDITELNVIDLKPGQVLVATMNDQNYQLMSDTQMRLTELFPNNEVIVKSKDLNFEVISGEDDGEA